MHVTVPSATLLGVDGPPGPRRGPRLGRAPRLHDRRPARHHVPRRAATGCGPRCSPAACAGRTQRVTVNLAPLRAAQGGRRPRPGHRRRPARGRPSSCPRAAWPTGPSSASWASTARSARCPGAVPLIDALTSPEVVVPDGVRGRGRPHRPPPGAAGRPPRRPGRRARRPGAVARATAAARGRRRRRPSPTWPTCGASPPPASRSRWRRPAAITCCWWARRAPGKTMLARRLAGRAARPAARPRRSRSTRVHSAAGFPLPAGGLVRRPPFRAPHHGASAASLVGGGSGAMQPGEVSLAHRRPALPRRDGRVRRPRPRRSCASRSRRG